MTDQASPNYPDPLGALTGGASPHPGPRPVRACPRPAPGASRTVRRLVLLLQNASGYRYRRGGRAGPPAARSANNRGRFGTKSPRVIGLQPGRGRVPPGACVHLADHRARPGLCDGVALDIQRLDKRPQRVRAAAGGAPSWSRNCPSSHAAAPGNPARAALFDAQRRQKEHHPGAVRGAAPCHQPLRELAGLGQLCGPCATTWTNTPSPRGSGPRSSTCRPGCAARRSSCRWSRARRITSKPAGTADAARKPYTSPSR